MHTKSLIAVGLIFSILVILSGIVAIPVANAAPNAASACSCLVYFENNKSLPAYGNYASAYNNAAYRYGDFLSIYKGSLSPKGYNVSYITPSTSGFGRLNLIGTAIVFNRGAFGADGTYGHIGIVTNASYNTSTRLWTIQYKDASGWTTADRKTITMVQGYSTESNCTNVAIRKLVTSSLSTVRFFYWWKK